MSVSVLEGFGGRTVQPDHLRNGVRDQSAADKPEEREKSTGERYLPSRWTWGSAKPTAFEW